MPRWAGAMAFGFEGFAFDAVSAVGGSAAKGFGVEEAAAADAEDWPGLSAVLWLPPPSEGPHTGGERDRW